MSTRTLPLDDQLHRYLQSVSVREPHIFERCRLETAELPMCSMQISPEQGQFMNLLLRVMGAKNAIELGSFTGYSGLWLASALPEKGRLVACDINEEWVCQARRYWQEAGLMNRIEIRLGDASDTLIDLIEKGSADHFDFIFVDADKANYDRYYELSLKLLRPGGVVAIDNVLWDGKVADNAIQDPDTSAIRQLNEKLVDDDRIDLSMIPIGDGLSLCRKR